VAPAKRRRCISSSLNPSGKLHQASVYVLSLLTAKNCIKPDQFSIQPQSCPEPSHCGSFGRNKENFGRWVVSKKIAESSRHRARKWKPRIRDPNVTVRP